MNTVGDGATSCSLRSAIQSANTDTAVGCCVAGSGADTIVLHSGSTYTLSIARTNDLNTTGDQVVTSPITIQVNGMNRARLNANGMERALRVAAGGNLTLRDVEIFGGVAQDNNGGGIANFGTALLERVIIRDNQARGASGTRVFSGAGGGVFNSGTLMIRDSQILRNDAHGGLGPKNQTGRGGTGGAGGGLGGGLFNNMGDAHVR
jgi:hypothetical protein